MLHPTILSPESACKNIDRLHSIVPNHLLSKSPIFACYAIPADSTSRAFHHWSDARSNASDYPLQLHHTAHSHFSRLPNQFLIPPVRLFAGFLSHTVCLFSVSLSLSAAHMSRSIVGVGSSQILSYRCKFCLPVSLGCHANHIPAYLSTATISVSLSTESRRESTVAVASQSDFSRVDCHHTSH